MSNEIKGFCSNCGCVLYYAQGTKTVTCAHCGTTAEPRTEWKATSTSEATGRSSAVVVGFDNPESALVYLENYFEKYDWTDYCESTQIALSDISEMVEANKVKNGASAHSWLLDFNSLAVPVANKIQGLANTAAKIAESCDDEDNTAVFAMFDTYKRITAKLIEEKDNIAKELELAIKYASRFNLDANLLADMNATLQNIKSSLGVLVEVKELSDIPAYAAAKKEADAKKAAEFRKAGVDAAAVYKEACDKYNSDIADKSYAVPLFESIRGYADSTSYINKINKYFNYHNEFFRFIGREFIFKRESFKFQVELPLLGKKDDAAKKGGKKEKAAPAPAKADPTSEEQSVMALSLYEIVDGVPAEKPVVTGIDQIITVYASRLYYVKKNKGIVYYDFHTESEVALDETKKLDDYRTGKNNTEYVIKLNPQKNGFYFKKKLPAVTIEAQGCFKTLFSKDAGPAHQDNNYSVIFVDMRNNTTSAMIPELVDIADIYDNLIFYTYAIPEGPKEKVGCFKTLWKMLLDKILKRTEAPREIKTCLMVCDVNTKESKSILDENCELHAVKDNKVIYSLWKPNPYNVDLRSYDFLTGEDVLIEDNVYDFVGVIKNYVYFTVGNDVDCPLVRANLDGTDRIEIMPNVENIVGERAGWIYVQKGKGRNAVLEKVSADGKERMLVCSQYKKFIKFTENNVYYIDTVGQLHRVRNDGKNDEVLAHNLANIILDANNIFFTRNEYVEDNEKANSLYRVDADGVNVKKLVFNIQKIADYDENTLYYSTEARTRFKVTIPTGDDKKKKKNAPEEPIYEYYTIKKYYEYDKKTGTSKVILTLGLPHGKTSYKTGCFLAKKDVEADIIYEEAPVVRTYRRRNIAQAGEVAEEQAEEARKEAENQPQGIVAQLKAKAQQLLKK